MRVLVTGANGLLGHHVVFELLKLEHEVNIIVRSFRNIHFDLNAVTVHEGIFTDYDRLKKAAEDCEAIIHIAAITSTDLLHYEDYRKINVDGSAQVIRVANELNIKKLVFVSSCNTVGFGSEKQPADETFPIQYPFSQSFYARSKVEAEVLFNEASLLPDRHVVIINPAFMIGAYDTKPSSGKLMLMGYKKWLMFIPKGGKNFVAASDVAAAVCNALTMGKNGERYLASGVNLSFREFYILQKKVENYPQLLLGVPSWLLLLAGLAGDLVQKLKIKTDICSRNLRQLIIREHYSNAKAVSELAMPQTQIETAISQALGWFGENGLTK